MLVTWKRNVLFETAVLFAERWRHLTYSNEPTFINNTLLVAKEYFHFKLSNVTKRATVACAQCASRTAVLACSPSNGLRKYQRTDERTNGRTDERTNGRTDERTNGRTDERTNGRTDERTNGRTDERTNGRTDERTNGRTDERTNGRMDERTNGRTDERTNGRTEDPRGLLKFNNILYLSSLCLDLDFRKYLYSKFFFLQALLVHLSSMVYNSVCCLPYW